MRPSSPPKQSGAAKVSFVACSNFFGISGMPQPQP
jgi:hypothetical protein